MTKDEMIQALRAVIAALQGEPEPPPPPEPPPQPDPTRPVTRVGTLANNHLRERRGTNANGGALWGSYPKRTDNPHRDRFYFIGGDILQVYVDGNIKWGKKKGAIRGDHSEHAFEVCEGQRFKNKDGGSVHLTTGNPPLFIYCRFVQKVG